MREDRDTWAGESLPERGVRGGTRRQQQCGRMAGMKRDQVRQVLAGLMGERNTLLDLQQRQARFVTEASQLVIHAMGVLARQQADALHGMFTKLADVGKAMPGPRLCRRPSRTIAFGCRCTPSWHS
jgi:hypothetical protein